MGQAITAKPRRREAAGHPDDYNPRRMATPASKISGVLVALVLGIGSHGCATVIGTALGPVTAPVSAIKHTEGVPPWAYPITFPILIPLGPIIGFAAGATADVSFVANGGYGEGTGAPFSHVFDPLGTDWGRATPDLPEGALGDRPQPVGHEATVPGGEGGGSDG